MEEELILENDVSQLVLLGQFLETIGKKYKLGDEMIGNLNLVLEEAVSNIIFYAYPGETNRLLRLILRRNADYLQIELRDSGVPFNPTSRENPDISLAAEEREIGGLGIFLIRQVMEKVEYRREDGDNVLCMSVKIT